MKSGALSTTSGEHCTLELSYALCQQPGWHEHGSSLLMYNLDCPLQPYLPRWAISSVLQCQPARPVTLHGRLLNNDSCAKSLQVPRLVAALVTSVLCGSLLQRRTYGELCVASAAGTSAASAVEVMQELLSAQQDLSRCQLIQEEHGITGNLL